MDLETIAVLGILGALVYYSGALDSLFGTGTTGNVSNFFTSISSSITGSKMTPQQIGQVASNAGWTGHDLVSAVAIALAESGGNPSILGDNNQSYGLWQIYTPMHPECGPNFQALLDPQTNANCAFGIYQRAGNSFTPWSTYPTIYVQFIPAVQQALGVTA